MTRAAYLLLLGVAVAGCGGDDGISLDELGQEMATVMCERLASCCTPDELREETFGSEDEAECVTVYTGLFDGLLVPVYQASLDAGRLSYDGTKMRACLDRIAALTCEDVARGQVTEGTFAECDSPFTGHVADGEECATDLDCVSGYCSGDALMSDGTPIFGTCATAPGISTPCDGFECAEGLACVSGTCIAPQPDGASCTSDPQCASGSCVGASGTEPGTCGPPMTCDGL